MNDQIADFRAERTNLTTLAGLDTAPVSLEPYRSQDWFDAEVSQVFKRAWLCLGREERIATSGDYFVQTLEFARSEVLVTRTKDGRIGSVAKIVKLEHAWRRLDGRNDDGFQVAPFPG